MYRTVLATLQLRVLMMEQETDVEIIVANVMRRTLPKSSYQQQTWLFVWRWSVLFGILTAGLWTVWSYFMSVPVIDKVLISKPEDYLVLVYPISRWWDVILIPVWVGLFILGLRWLLPQQSSCGDTVVGFLGAIVITVIADYYGLNTAVFWMLGLVLGQACSRMFEPWDFGLPTVTTLLSVLGILAVVTFGSIILIVLLGAVLVWFLADWRLAGWLHGY